MVYNALLWSSTGQGDDQILDRTRFVINAHDKFERVRIRRHLEEQFRIGMRTNAVLVLLTTNGKRSAIDSAIHTRPPVLLREMVNRQICEVELVR